MDYQITVGKQVICFLFLFFIFYLFWGERTETSAQLAEVSSVYRVGSRD